MHSRAVVQFLSTSEIFCAWNLSFMSSTTLGGRSSQVPCARWNQQQKHQKKKKKKRRSRYSGNDSTAVFLQHRHNSGAYLKAKVRRLVAEALRVEVVVHAVRHAEHNVALAAQLEEHLRD